MKKPELSTEELEEILQQLPSIRDRRTVAEIYESLQLNKLNKKKIKYWSTPVLTGIAALLIIAFISPYFFEQLKENATDESKYSAIQQPEEENNGATLFGNEQKELSKDNNEKTFVIKNEESNNMITVAFPDKETKTVVPLSIEGTQGENRAEQINDILKTFNDDELGLNTVALKGITMSISHENPAEVIVNLEKPETLDSLKDETLFNQIISESLRWQGFEEVKFYTHGKPGIALKGGERIEYLKLNQAEKKGYFIFEDNEKAEKLLAPSNNQYDSIIDAFKAMEKEMSAQNLKPSILDDFSDITVKADGNILNVNFKDGVSFENSDPYIMMLEAILLTAKDFGYESVKFNGIDIGRIGKMDVTKSVEVPYSPNPVK
ncbi:hypothetical protein [Metabacillus fastidiosus]|uniref:hypothetical protein n=1 Tax=Metabacillus fastidiosus TaxID=1458 RepID=UPI002DBDE82C|nr:hypothetical protein [Metabacillus fastidiosus]MEC2075716.1 hypothetical protein [Metabacillus fastidiosus]